jgi:hypothetical protein
VADDHWELLYNVDVVIPQALAEVTS